MTVEHIDAETRLVLLGGLGGLGLAVLLILLIGLVPLFAKGGPPGVRILGDAGGSFGRHWQAALGITLSAALASAFSGILSDLGGWHVLPMIADPLILAVLVFAGHRLFLSDAARQHGIRLPDGGLWNVILRALSLTLLLFSFVILAVLAGAILFAISGYLGIVADPVRIGIGAMMGLVTGFGSILFARLSFLYPAAVLGRKAWFLTAFRQARKHGIGLSAALWAIALVSLALAALAILAGDKILALTVYADRAGLGLLSSPDIAGSRAYWLETITIELPFRIVFMGYALASVASVSAAYSDDALSGPEPNDFP